MTFRKFGILQRKAVSLVEILLALGLLAVVLVPTFSLYLSSRAIVYSSGRILVATILGQTLLEGAAQLDPLELPLPADTGAEEWQLLPPSGTPPAGSRFQKIVDLFQQATPFPMERVLVAQWPPGAAGAGRDRLILRMTVRFRRIESDPESEYEVLLRTLVVKPAP